MLDTRNKDKFHKWIQRTPVVIRIAQEHIDDREKERKKDQENDRSCNHVIGGLVLNLAHVLYYGDPYLLEVRNGRYTEMRETHFKLKMEISSPLLKLKNCIRAHAILLRREYLKKFDNRSLRKRKKMELNAQATEEMRQVITSPDIIEENHNVTITDVLAVLKLISRTLELLQNLDNPQPLPTDFEAGILAINKYYRDDLFESKCEFDILRYDLEKQWKNPISYGEFEDYIKKTAVPFSKRPSASSLKRMSYETDKQGNLTNILKDGVPLFDEFRQHLVNFNRIYQEIRHPSTNFC